MNLTLWKVGLEKTFGLPGLSNAGRGHVVCPGGSAAGARTFNRGSEFLVGSLTSPKKAASKLAKAKYVKRTLENRKSRQVENELASVTCA